MFNCWDSVITVAVASEGSSVSKHCLLQSGPVLLFANFQVQQVCYRSCFQKVHCLVASVEQQLSHDTWRYPIPLCSFVNVGKFIEDPSFAAWIRWYKPRYHSVLEFTPGSIDGFIGSFCKSWFLGCGEDSTFSPLTQRIGYIGNQSTSYSTHLRRATLLIRMIPVTERVSLL